MNSLLAVLNKAVQMYVHTPPGVTYGVIGSSFNELNVYFKKCFIDVEIFDDTTNPRACNLCAAVYDFAGSVMGFMTLRKYFGGKGTVDDFVIAHVVDYDSLYSSL